jgi:hypothetical protein
MAKIWDTRFAESGDKIAIPEPVQAGGEVSVTTGWTPDYELPDTDPDYKPVGREEMNGVLFEMTDSLQQLQKQGAAEWSPDLAPYGKGAEVIHASERWYSPVAGNSTEPGAVGTTWVIAGSVPDASETLKGIAELATIAEVLAGTDTSRIVTPASLLAGLLGAGGTSAADYVTIPFRDKTSGVRRNLIVQWGTNIPAGGNTNNVVTFPVTFPNACLTVILGDTRGDPAGGDAGSAVLTASITASQFTYFYAWDGATPAGLSRYLAIGY